MKSKKIGWNLLFITIVTIGLFIYLFAVDGVNGVVNALKNARPAWLLIAMALMVGYWLLEALILHLAVKPFYNKQRFESTLRTTMIGQFFNCVTPFASGGQPMQLIHMARSGVPVGISSCSLLIKFVVYQFVLTIYSLITLILEFGMFSAKISNLKYLVFIGFSVNTAVILGLLSIFFFRRHTIKLAGKTINLLFKLKIVKDKEVITNSVNASIDQFYDGFQMLRRDKGLFLQMIFLSIVQLTAYFLIPFIIFKAFGLVGASMFSMLAAQAFVLNISSFVPLPGAAGGAELSFTALFALFFPANLLTISVVLWRLLTFYLPILTGMLFVVDFSKKTDNAPNIPAAPAA